MAEGNARLKYIRRRLALKYSYSKVYANKQAVRLLVHGTIYE